MTALIIFSVFVVIIILRDYLEFYFDMDEVDEHPNALTYLNMICNIEDYDGRRSLDGLTKLRDELIEYGVFAAEALNREIVSKNNVFSMGWGIVRANIEKIINTNENRTSVNALMSDIDFIIDCAKYAKSTLEELYAEIQN